MKNRKASAPSPTSTYLTSPIMPLVDEEAAAAGVAILANGSRADRDRVAALGVEADGVLHRDLIVGISVAGTSCC